MENRVLRPRGDLPAGHPNRLWAALVALPHTAFYRFMRRIARVLLAAKVTILVAALAILALDAAITRAHAGILVAASQAGQMELDAILHELPSEEVARTRSGCAMGQLPSILAREQKAGFNTAPVSAICVTALTRLGREGKLGFVKAPGEQSPRPSVVFDTGFVNGYLQHAAIPTNSPTMAALLPLADRCLAESETNATLCTAAGQLLGARAAQGETVTLR